MNKSKSKRIGLYIRVSTEEQAQNPEGSIKNQQERLLQMVKLKNMDDDFGEVVDVFIDRAKSGKDTNRPELQIMLGAIRTNKIDLVMASELSRISRSIKDFSEIWEMMRENRCGFMSLRENFDTETAAGEMVLYTLANIAQFERRQVSERVSANMQARAKRGLYNGGSVPMGYIIDPERKGTLIVDPEQAKTVKTAFETFIQEGTLSKTVKYLNDHGYRLKRFVQGGGAHMRSSQFTVDNLHKMFTNEAYIALKTYKEKREVRQTKAVWKAIVEKDLFNRVNEILKSNRSRKKPYTKERYPYLLTGITFCKVCGDRLCGKSAHGKTKKIGYYEHSWRTKRNASFSKKQFSCENYDRFLATKLEGLVIQEIEKLLGSKELGVQLLEEANKQYKGNSKSKEANSLKAQINGYNSQLDALAERLGELPKKVSPKPLFKQMEKIEEQKAIYEKRLDEWKLSGVGIKSKPIELDDYEALLKALKGLWLNGDPETKSKIIGWLIGKIEVGRDTVVLHYQLGETIALSKPGSEMNVREFFCHSSSNSLTNGAREGT